MIKQKQYLYIIIIIVIIMSSIILVNNTKNNSNNENTIVSQSRYKYNLVTMFYANNSGEKYVKINTSWAGIRLTIQYNTSNINHGGYVKLIAPNNKTMISLRVMSNSENPNTTITGSSLNLFYPDTIPPDIPQNSLWKIKWSFSGVHVKIILERAMLNA